MIKVCNILFSENKTYLAEYHKDYENGEFVVCETIKGLEIGQIVDIYEEDEKKFKAPLLKIIRKASNVDFKNQEKNNFECEEVTKKVKELVRNFNLDMKIISSEYTLDREKLLIYFLSQDRVDFRELVKEINSLYPTRIELRQISAREGAKLLGGIGPCGLIICCNNFIGDFASVSIKMAKNQNLSLNPLKISGNCDKLLCCIKYEDETYSKIKKELPDVGETINYNGVDYKIVEISLLKNEVKILLDPEEKRYSWINLKELE